MKHSYFMAMRKENGEIPGISAFFLHCKSSLIGL